MGGGRLELHGQHFASWERLSTSVYPGDSMLALQSPVNWVKGQKV